MHGLSDRGMNSALEKDRSISSSKSKIAQRDKILKRKGTFNKVHDESKMRRRSDSQNSPVRPPPGNKVCPDRPKTPGNNLYN